MRNHHPELPHGLRAVPPPDGDRSRSRRASREALPDRRQTRRQTLRRTEGSSNGDPLRRRRRAFVDTPTTVRPSVVAELQDAPYPKLDASTDREALHGQRGHGGRTRLRRFRRLLRSTVRSDELRSRRQGSALPRIRRGSEHRFQPPMAQSGRQALRPGAPGRLPHLVRWEHHHLARPERSPTSCSCRERDRALLDSRACRAFP